MNVSRADFLKICTGVLFGHTAAASTLPAAAGGAQPAASLTASCRVGEASAAVFQPHVNSTFAVRTSAGASLPLVLAQVTERPLARGIDQFSLMFHAAPGSPLPQGTHAFQHPALGAFDLFIGPVGSAGARHIAYEACFTRHVGAAQEGSATCPITS